MTDWLREVTSVAERWDADAFVGLLTLSLGQVPRPRADAIVRRWLQDAIAEVPDAEPWATPLLTASEVTDEAIAEHPEPGGNTLLKALEDWIDDRDDPYAQAQAIHLAIEASVLAAWGQQHPAEWKAWFESDSPPGLGFGRDPTARALRQQRWIAVMVTIRGE